MTIVNGLNGTIKLAIEELQSGSALFGTAGGTDTYTLSISNITANPRFLFVIFTNSNTTSSTINLNGIGAVTLKKSVSTNLASGDIAAGSFHILGYDGTNYQVLTLGGGGSGSGDVVGPASATNGAVVLYDGTTGKLIKNSTILPTTVGIAIANLTNPSAVTFIRINADNSVTARTAAQMLSDLGAGTGTVNSGSQYRLPYYSTNPTGTVLDAAAAITAAKALKSDGNGLPTHFDTATEPSLTELTYVKGVTSAIQTQMDLKAPLASPTFTGTPSAPTAAVNTNTTQLATTAFVQAEIANEASIANVAAKLYLFNAY